MQRVLLLVTVIASRCSQQGLNIEIAEQMFARAEYIPERGRGADGWAEARRRRLLVRLFEKNGRSAREAQETSDTMADKYRQVRLSIGQAFLPNRALTFALIPTATDSGTEDFRRRQQQCDLYLFNALKAYLSDSSPMVRLDLVQTKTCLHLTEQISIKK